MFAYIPCLIKFTEHDFPLALAKFNSIEYVFCNQISLHRLAAGKEIIPNTHSPAKTNVFQNIEGSRREKKNSNVTRRSTRKPLEYKLPTHGPNRQHRPHPGSWMLDAGS